MRFTSDRLAGPLVRGVARVARIAWLVAAVWVALRNGSRPAVRDIGGGVTADCGRVFASQVPQLVLGVSGAALLIVAAARDAVGVRVLVGAGVVLVAWALAAAVLPGAFSWDCVN